MSQMLLLYTGMNLGLLHQAGVLFRGQQVAVQLVIPPQNLTSYPITFSLPMLQLLGSTKISSR